jgi:hypothetical protein
MNPLRDPGFRRRLGYFCLGLAIGFVILAFIQMNRPRTGPGLFAPPPAPPAPSAEIPSPTP